MKNKHPHKAYFRKGDVFRTLAMIAVILIHILSNKQPISLTENKISWWINNFFVVSLRWCVPIFIMLSGVLLIKPQNKQNIKLFYKKRLKRVLVPLISWIIIYFFWRKYQGDTITIENYFIQAFIDGLPYYHLYFLYIIIGLYIITPIINWLLKKTNLLQSIYITITIFILSITSNMIKLWFQGGWENNLGNSISYFLPYIGYFLAGYLLKNITIKQKKYKATLWFSYLFSVLIGVMGTFLLMNKYGYTNRGMIFDDYLNPIIVIESLSIFLLINNTSLKRIKNFSQRQIFKSFAKHSLGVYLIHPIIISIFEMYVQTKLSGLNQIFINFIVEIPFVIALSYIITKLISKIPVIKVAVGVK